MRGSGHYGIGALPAAVDLLGATAFGVVRVGGEAPYGFSADEVLRETERLDFSVVLTGGVSGYPVQRGV